MEPLLAHKIMVYPVRGNHDLVQEGGDSVNLWNEIFKGKYGLPDNGPEKEKGITFSFHYKNAFFLGLDTYLNDHRVNQRWLDKQLKDNERPHVFAFTHEPAYSLKGGHRDCLAVHKKARDIFIQSLIGSGSKVFFCGHDHWYDHARIEFTDNVYFHQLTAGTAGAPLRDWSSKEYSEKDIINIAHRKAYGYMIVEIQGLKVEMVMKIFNDEDEIEVIDRFGYEIKE